MGDKIDVLDPNYGDNFSHPGRPEDPQNSPCVPRIGPLESEATATVETEVDTSFSSGASTELAGKFNANEAGENTGNEANDRPRRQRRSREEKASATVVSYRQACTFEPFSKQFQRDCRHRWKPATFKTHCGQIKRQLVPEFGAMLVLKIKSADVIRWYENPSKQCPRALAVLSSMMRYAEEVGLRPHGSNPCVGLRRKQSEFKAYYLGNDDYLRIGEALDQSREASPVLVGIVEFLALTGARKGEALAAEWRHLEDDRIVFPDSKSGPKTIWLPVSVSALIKQLPRTPRQRYLFGKGSRTVMSSRLTTFWYRLRAKHGLPQMRLHDFRHGFASRGVNLELDLRTVGRLLGHSDFSSTIRYAHLDEAPLKRAAERVGKRLRGGSQPSNESDERDSERGRLPHSGRARGGRRGR